LLARINLWTFGLPALRERREDIEPNLEFELKRYSEREGSKVSFNKEARDSYLAFATSEAAIWASNFRDLGASATRMATLAPAGRIDLATVSHEIATLKRLWRGKSDGRRQTNLRVAQLQHQGLLQSLDLFDEAQLETVLEVCQSAATLSEAGRKLFSQSRNLKTSTNDADRLRKYLTRFELSFDHIKGLLEST
jgi:transcriptional regulatory protein RtcR